MGGTLGIGWHLCPQAYPVEAKGNAPMAYIAAADAVVKRILRM
jgi:hypothetical protein